MQEFPLEERSGRKREERRLAPACKREDGIKIRFDFRFKIQPRATWIGSNSELLLEFRGCFNAVDVRHLRRQHYHGRAAQSTQSLNLRSEAMETPCSLNSLYLIVLSTYLSQKSIAVCQKSDVLGRLHCDAPTERVDIAAHCSQWVSKPRWWCKCNC